MKPFDNDGRELDAIFAVRKAENGRMDLILESRGGGEDGPRPPRNADYAPAFELLLRRLGRGGATLTGIEVYSNVTQGWPEADRKITAPSYPLPLKLSELVDVQAFRLELGRASAALGRERGKTGGNPTKRLRLQLDWADTYTKTAGELEDILANTTRADGRELSYEALGGYLRARSESELRLKLSEITVIVGGPLPPAAWTPQFWAEAAELRHSEWLAAGYRARLELRSETVIFHGIQASPNANILRLEERTADPDALRLKVKAAKGKMRQAGDKLQDPPRGSAEVEKVTASTTRYVRDPNVIAWVLIAAGGRCEVCDDLAPFDGHDGEPFLEVHHVRPLAEGGPDTTDNALAACPNCHRRLHFGQDREITRRSVIAKVKRLNDYPAKANKGTDSGAEAYAGALNPS